MNVARIFRTVKYLTAEQWFFRIVNRGKRIYVRYFPGFAENKIREISQNLPFPNLSNSNLNKALFHVAKLQDSQHLKHLDKIKSGCFTFLNRTIDFKNVENIIWRQDLGEKNNPLWRMNLSYMGYAVPLLATGERDNLIVVLKILRTLVAQNQWTEPGVFRDVWFSYAVSHRLINLLCGMAMYIKVGGEVDRNEKEEILQHIKFCAAFILKNLERELQYNHLLKNYVALSLYCASIDKIPSEFIFLKSSVLKSINQQVLCDGGHAERSPMYHLLTILDLKILLDCQLFNSHWHNFLKDTIKKMEDALSLMSHPHGDISLFNDSWIGEGPKTKALIPQVSFPAISRLPETGYVRLDGGKDVVIFDCGPCGPDENPGHAHADFLSVEVSVNGDRFIVDPGVPTYSVGALRDISRSASSHNGPCFIGYEPIEFWASFRVGRRGTAKELLSSKFEGFAPVWCAGYQTGYEHIGAKVKRFIGLWPDRGLLIVDQWTGGDRIEAMTNFLVSGAWSFSDESVLTFTKHSCNVEITSLAGNIQPVVSSSCWPRFGHEVAAYSIKITPTQVNKDRCIAVLFTWGSEKPKFEFDSLTCLLKQLSRI